MTRPISLLSAIRRRRHTKGGRAGVAGSPGQSMVELALLMPVLMLFLVAIVDLGPIPFAQETIAGAAQMGAFFGSTSSAAADNTAGIEAASMADCANLRAYSATSPKNPTVTSSKGTDAGGFDTVTVTVTYSYPVAFPYLGVPSSFTLARTAKMRVKP